MKLRWSPLLALALAPMLGALFPACDAEEDCPAGHEGCMCTEEFQCLDGLQCLSDYCVDPQSNASDGSGGGDSSSPSGSGSTNNVQACETFLDSLECAELPGGVMLLDCSVYESSTCDITDYLDCLTDNTTCTDGIADNTGWMECTSLVEDDCE